ncbi:hypothetical protein AADZ90_021855 [Aestuariibius sp. 2305UL40-4]
MARNEYLTQEQYDHCKAVGRRGGDVPTDSMPSKQKEAVDSAVIDGKNGN